MWYASINDQNQASLERTICLSDPFLWVSGSCRDRYLQMFGLSVSLIKLPDFSDSNSVPEGQQTEKLTGKVVDIVLFVIWWSWHCNKWNIRQIIPLPFK